MRPRLVVLAYHAIGDHREDTVLARWSVSRPTFVAQLDAVAAAGWSFVGLDDCAAALAGSRTLPPRSVLVTFDDGYADLLDTVQPILAERGIPAVAFVVAGHLGGTNQWDVAVGARSVSLLDADGLHELAGSGFEIGSHSMSHSALSGLGADGWAEELAGSAERLEQIGLPRPRALAYPYGDCPVGAKAVLADAGYQLAFTLGPGAIVPSRGFDPLLLPRVAVLGSDSPRDLLLKLRTATWRSRPRRALLRACGVDL